MRWGRLVWLSSYAVLGGVVVLGVAITLQVLAPRGQVGQVEITTGVGIPVGEQTPLNYLGEALIGLGIGGLLISGARSGISSQLAAHARRVERRGVQAVARRAEQLFARGMGIAEVRAALSANGITEQEIDLGLQLDWPKGRRCPRCGESLRKFAQVRKPQYCCPNCGWLGDQTARAA